MTIVERMGRFAARASYDDLPAVARQQLKIRVLDPSAARALTPLVPVALLVAALVGSVLIPAGQAWRIMRLLREQSEVIEPARLLASRLQSGLAVEYSTLERYAVTGDSSLLQQYRSTSDDHLRRLGSLEGLAPRLGARAVEDVAAVRHHVGTWQDLNRVLVDGRLSPDQRVAAARTQRVLRDSIVGGIDRLSARLTSEAATRRAEVRAYERLSLFVNAGLVVVALSAIVAVVGLTLRERRLAAALQRRVEEEAALRRMARGLSAAVTVDEAMQRIVEGTVATTRACGAYIELVSPEADSVLAVALTGAGTPPVSAEAPYAGSLTEEARTWRSPTSLAEVGEIGERLPPDLAARSARRTGLVAPLRSVDETFGVLVLLRRVTADRFREDERRQVRLLSDLAAAVLRRIEVERRALSRARERRRELERVMKSRAHLIRGFSHDVKNPLGAADGYAELLSSGVYGELSTPQTESLARVRRSIHRALTLIDDLHELARAETGHIPLSRALVDLGELARTSGDDYRAAAQASGLSLDVDVAPDLPPVDTDGARIRQIVGNLLSNAIKYTRTGSVTVRARVGDVESARGGRGWALVEVIDTGIGIPADKRDLVFDEFRRLSADDTSGAGLGLAISKRVAEALGGRISVESQVGRGSTFTLWIPITHIHALEQRPPPREALEAWAPEASRLTPGNHETTRGYIHVGP